MDKRGVSPAVSLLRKAGGWPVLDNWSGEGWTILETEVRLRKLGITGGSLFSIGVNADPKNNSRRVIEVDQASLPFRREFLLQGVDDPVVQAYLKYMVDIAVLLGANKTVAEQDLRQCLLFQIELAKIMSAAQDRTQFDRMYNLFSLDSLQHWYPWIDWHKLIRNILPTRVHLTTDQPVIVYEVDFLQKLKTILDSHPKRVIANYMLWSAVREISAALTRGVRDRGQDFQRVLTGAQTMLPRWKKCIHVASGFSFVISSLYVERFFNGDAKQEALKIVQEIQQEMSTNIDSLDWMHQDTKLKGKEKVKKVLEFIGYPDEILDIKKLEEFYKKLVLDEQHYFEALLDFSKWAEDFSFGLLHEPVNRSDWRTHGYVTDVNAFYGPQINAMEFPAGILQAPFFSADIPKYINYATMGTIVGHELTHGFDNQGSQFDGEGNIHNWWDETSKRNFNKKTECMIKQYSNFKDNQTQMNINGKLTLGENVADNGGLKIAYNSWVRHASAALEPGLPGLERFTNKQLFMLSIANMWCTNYRTESLKLLTLTDEHTPSQFRVNGVLQNFPAFSEAFQCARGQPMNPELKCDVW